MPATAEDVASPSHSDDTTNERLNQSTISSSAPNRSKSALTTRSSRVHRSSSGRVRWKDDTSTTRHIEDDSEVSYGGILVAKSGVEVSHDADAVLAHMKQDEAHITVHLGVGEASATTIGIDLGPGYIAENVVTS